MYRVAADPEKWRTPPAVEGEVKGNHLRYDEGIENDVRFIYWQRTTDVGYAITQSLPNRLRWEMRARRSGVRDQRDAVTIPSHCRTWRGQARNYGGTVDSGGPRQRLWAYGSSPEVLDGREKRCGEVVDHPLDERGCCGWNGQTDASEKTQKRS